MKYFLDFDGVIFNTEALKEKMAQLGMKESERTASLFDAIHTADPDFDIRSLVFRDAQRFLDRHGDDCYIVSSYVSTNPQNNLDTQTQQAYQERKIMLSGVTKYLHGEHIHVVGESKKDMLALLKQGCDAGGERCLFIDDRKEYVEEADELGILSVWMQRSGEGSQSQLRTVPSFDVLEQFLETWNT